MAKKITKTDISYCKRIKKSGRTVHKFGGKVYIGPHNAITTRQLTVMIEKGLLKKSDKEHHYELTKMALRELDNVE